MSKPLLTWTKSRVLEAIQEAHTRVEKNGADRLETSVGDLRNAVDAVAASGRGRWRNEWKGKTRSQTWRMTVKALKELVAEGTVCPSRGPGIRGVKVAIYERFGRADSLPMPVADYDKAEAEPDNGDEVHVYTQPIEGVNRFEKAEEILQEANRDLWRKIDVLHDKMGQRIDEQDPERVEYLIEEIQARLLVLRKLA